MVNRKRITNTFCDLVRVDSIAGDERKMADLIRQKLSEMGYDSEEDNAGEIINGNGEYYRVFKEQAASLLLLAHMDTVEPGRGKVPIIVEYYQY